MKGKGTAEGFGNFIESSDPVVLTCVFCGKLQYEDVHYYAAYTQKGKLTFRNGWQTKQAHTNPKKAVSPAKAMHFFKHIEREVKKEGRTT